MSTNYSSVSESKT